VWDSPVNSIYSAAIEILTVLFVREMIFVHYLDKVTVVAVAASNRLHAAKQSVPWMRIHLTVDLVQGSRKIHSAKQRSPKGTFSAMIHLGSCTS
jgi:hypothetical protein